MSVIYYQKFSENEVFADPLLNTSLNQLFTLLINILTEDIVIPNLIITGDVAQIMQGVDLTTTTAAVELITDNKEIFNCIKSGYSNLNVSQVIVNDAKVTMVINEKLIIVNFNPVKVESFDIYGIYVKSVK
ncbi:hypothetical protein G6N05_05475 [Flavobacterium sp. F372]|uniref:GerMN domain-containing protein n=1 Tax=Flavobacterium bernardetii TaxID=2813823 RepID=A0ABR7J1C2_9FLAO|nr:hypothetical protein [Flavobacterium bernardetii]MBC5835831.1 hypothetical protein [Flavobacterium bernardetii]NHF69561.1 hypothetical protein [Flavobacterium bernardetii]